MASGGVVVRIITAVGVVTPGLVHHCLDEIQQLKQALVGPRQTRDVGTCEHALPLGVGPGARAHNTQARAYTRACTHALALPTRSAHARSHHHTTGGVRTNGSPAVSFTPASLKTP